MAAQAVGIAPYSALWISSSGDTSDVPPTTAGTLAFPLLEPTEGAEGCSNLSSSCAKSLLICGFISCL